MIEDDQVRLQREVGFGVEFAEHAAKLERQLAEVTRQRDADRETLAVYADRNNWHKCRDVDGYTVAGWFGPGGEGWTLADKALTPENPR